MREDHSRRPSPVLAAVTLSIALVACGVPEDAATTTSSTSTTTSTTSTTLLEPTTSTTGAVTTTTTAQSTTTTSTTGLPGDPIDFGPGTGDILGVVGVAHDDVLNLRAAPGATQQILAGIPPLYSSLVAAGNTRQLTSSIWIEVEYSGTEGWVNLRYVSYLGATKDATADIVSNLGGIPEAESMIELGLIVAESISAQAPGATFVMSARPTGQDPNEVTYDIVGLEDDSVRGSRIRVVGQPVAGGNGLQSVDVTPFCSRGVDQNGQCV